MLREATLAYETWGELNDERSNAVLVCHALTGDSHVQGPSGPGHPTGGWWEDLIGPGKALDTGRYFLVCSNVLGGCQGSTGPASPHPDDGRPYGSRFPVVSIRDMVRAQRYLADELGIERWLTVIGGSMGGMQVLEWGVLFPDRVRSLVPIASSAAASAQQIAWSAVGRMAIANDPNWRDGDYYDAAPGAGPHAGLALARQIAQIHYRSEAVFANASGGSRSRPSTTSTPGPSSRSSRYLDHHGDKLVRRFDANTYLVLNRAMDFHDLARGRGSLQAALARIDVPVCTMSITHRHPVPALPAAGAARRAGGAGHCRSPTSSIDSPHGHDGFLLEFDQVGPGVAKFLASL